MEDFELTLYDRIETIRSANKKYDLENNAYISFSGGKDSTILHYLIDMALPNNKIPRVYINTGVEYVDMVKFVKIMMKEDNRIEIVTPNKPIKYVLDKYGYPFKSKEHSERVRLFNSGSDCSSVKKYISQSDDKDSRPCPKILLYQFENRGGYNISNRCCYELKKKPAHQWSQKNKRKIVLTGMRRAEGGQRANIKGCILTDKNGNVVKFHPLLPTSDEFEKWFIEKFNIKLCKLYYPPFSFDRLGCKGCPYTLDLQHQLDMLEKYLPFEKKQCELIWKPVYDEYRRLNYRLKSEKQLSLDDYLD